MRRWSSWPWRAKSRGCWERQATRRLPARAATTSPACSPVEDWRHQHQDVRVLDGVQFGDLPEFVDFKYVAQVARVNGAALATLALGPAAPSQVELENLKLENDTTLRWKANAEPDVAGYRIVWRETTAPSWQYSKDVGNVTRFTLEGISKDNYSFGLQAYDKDGFSSVASVPTSYRPQPPAAAPAK